MIVGSILDFYVLVRFILSETMLLELILLLSTNALGPALLLRRRVFVAWRP